METETLFYKEHIVSGKDVDIIFHRDYTYIFNEATLCPVVKFTLTNCRDLASIKFDSIDYYNDGAIVDIDKENDLTLFRTTDMGGIKVEIFCDKVIREDIEYGQSDLIDIIKLTKSVSDDNYDRMIMFSKRIDGLTNFLKHDLDIIERKLEQASWLAVDKKQFLEGQRNIIMKVIQFIEKKKKEDFQKSQDEQKMQSDKTA